jgi:hypothetical protein
MNMESYSVSMSYLPKLQARVSTLKAELLFNSASSSSLSIQLPYTIEPASSICSLTLLLDSFAREDTTGGYHEFAPKPTSSDNSPGHTARPAITKQTPIQSTFKPVEASGRTVAKCCNER